MSLKDWMFGRKPDANAVDARSRTAASEKIRSGTAAIREPAPGEGRFPKLTDGKPEVLTLTATSANATKDGPVATTNIWDIETSPVVAAAAPEPAPQRKTNRNKTRVLGFEPQAAAVVSLFDEGRMEDVGQPGVRANVVNQPTGWLVVIEGPGRGASFALMQGVSQIGRGTDQTVSLDFGDMTISRQNHAAIAYDPMTHQFHVGHGGKANLVRLNGRPLLSTEPINDGDRVQIGETMLMLKVLCTPAFNWSQSEAGGDAHDMAIA